jgi:hypothetical protein
MTLDELDDLIEIALTDKAMADLRYDELKRKHDAVIKIGRNAKLFEWEIRKAWDEGRDARDVLAKLATERLRIELTDKLARVNPDRESADRLKWTRPEGILEDLPGF